MPVFTAANASATVCKGQTPGDQFDRRDQLHMLAAEGWLELGSPVEAARDVAEVSRLQHRDVLRMKCLILQAAKEWEGLTICSAALCDRFPEVASGWIGLAEALHRTGRTNRAWQILLCAADKFPDRYLIAFNLARYACRLCDLKGARVWIDRAFYLGDFEAVKNMAQDEPDLGPLWPDIADRRYGASTPGFYFTGEVPDRFSSDWGG